jgi:hypothetical protein
MTAISTDIEVGGDALGELSASFKGELVRPGDPAYDEHRKVWNGLDRLDRTWQARGCDTLVRDADDLVVMCGTERNDRRALAALRALLAELGASPERS